jgi:hypothetical protein
MTVAWLGFSTAGLNNPTDRPAAEITNFKKKLNSLLNFRFTCLNNLKHVERRKSSLFIPNFYFATSFCANFAAASWTLVFAPSAAPPHPSYAPGKRMPDGRQTNRMSRDLKQENIEHLLQQCHDTRLSETDRAIKTEACFASSQITNLTFGI